MKEFCIGVFEEYFTPVRVEAKTFAEAIEKVKEAHRNKKIKFDYDCVYEMTADDSSDLMKDLVASGHFKEEIQKI